MNNQQPPQFIIYNASAGSGKTFTLVRNYIADLLTGERSFRNILAITFTNKAVAEMKERIIDTLKGMGTSPLPPSHAAIFKEIQVRTGLSPEEIVKKSRQILKDILHNYAGFEISTIDSFTHRILQIFAKDLNIPANFEVQLDQDEILQEAVDLVIAKAGSDPELTNTLIDFALRKADDDRSWDITKDLNDIAKLILNENNFVPLHLLRPKSLKDFQSFRKKLIQHIKQLKEERQTAGREFFLLIEKKGLDPKDFPKGVLNVFRALAQGEWKKPSTAGWAQRPEENAPYNKTLSNAKKSIIDSFSDAINQLYKRTENCYFKVEFYTRILKRLSATSLLSAIEKEVNQIKDERGLLLISEFNKKISESIKGEPAPFIYERLGERFSSFYIDEFQDTSVLQWENLKPLIAESLATENGNLTLIGDAKQSIYRWRGGKVEQFMALSGKENPFFVDKHIKNLPKNYRSAQTIVNFNNAFFNFSTRYLHTEAYAHLFEQARQEPAISKEGLVDIQFIEAANQSEKDAIYPEKVYEIIRELETQYPKNHPLYREICILIRKKKEAIPIANYLIEKDIPIISSESLLVKNSSLVNFIINLMNFSLRPNDKTLKFEILDFLYQQRSYDYSHFEFIHPKLYQNGDALFSILKEEGYNFTLKKFEQLPLYDAVEYSLREFQLLKEVDAYVTFFLDFIYEYTQRHIGGITGFIELWELKKDKLTIVTPEGRNAVQIMTVHKAKGLEFPIVIYPYADTKIDDTGKDKLWIPMGEEAEIPIVNTDVSKDFTHYGETPKAHYLQLLAEKEMDEMNVLYVALTRPQQQLYILTKREKPNKKSGVYANTYSTWLQEFLKDQKLWEDEKSRYQWGQVQIPQYTPSTNHESLETPAEEFISSAPEEHQITVVTKSGELWDAEREKAIERGNLIHQLLKNIKTEPDLSTALESGVLSGTIDKEEVKELQSLLKKIVFHKDLNPYFTDQYTIYTEKEILTQHQFKRLDRLCIKGDKAVIIDYKTGDFAPSHRQQVEEYAAAIKDFGYEIENQILVYISEEIHIKKIP